MKIKLVLILLLSILFMVNAEIFQLNEVNEELGGDEWKSPYKKREDARFQQQQDEMRRLTGYATTGKIPSNIDKCTGIKCPSGYNLNHNCACLKKCGLTYCIVSTDCEKDLIGIHFCRPPRGKAVH